MANKLFTIFDRYPDLLIEFSDKADGAMKPTGDSVVDGKIFDNRDKFLKKLRVNKDSLVALDQVHEDKVLLVKLSHGGKLNLVADGLLTREKNLYLSIRVADCLPIYIFDPRSKVIGLVHCGWRSLSMNIIDKALTLAQKVFGLDTNSTIVGIGPGICSRHFEVKEGVAREFKDYPESVIRRDGKLFVDLKAITKKQLVEAGVKEDNIEISPICTFEDINYFSFRRDKPKYVEAMVAIIGVRS